MSNVLQVDCTNGAGYVELDLGFPGPSEVWIEFDIAFNATCLAAILALASGSSLNFAASGSSAVFAAIEQQGGVLKWKIGTAAPFTPSSIVTSMQFYRVKLHLQAGLNGPSEMFVGGISVGIDTSVDTSGNFEYTNLSEDIVAPGGFVYYNNFKIGTTEGANDLGSDDFEGGSLAFWNSGTNDASIVTDPGITPPVIPPLTDSATVSGVTTPIFVDEGIDGNIITSRTTVSSSDNLALLDSAIVSSTTSLVATEVTTTEILVVTEVSTGLAIGDTIDFVVSSTIITTTSVTDIPPPPPTDITYAISITTTDYNNQSWIVAYSYNSGAATTAGTVASFDGDNGLIPIA